MYFSTKPRETTMAGPTLYTHVYYNRSNALHGFTNLSRAHNIINSKSMLNRSTWRELVKFTDITVDQGNATS